MDINDIKKVLHVASTQNLQLSSLQLALTPGALSKVVKKQEDRLGVQLFDRIHKSLRLNDNGKLFVRYATQLVHDYEQMTSVFAKQGHLKQFIVAGPALITDYWLMQILPHSYGNPPNDQAHAVANTPRELAMPWTSKNALTVKLHCVFEGKAIEQLNAGFAHAAIVTGEALGVNTAQLACIKLADTHFQVAISEHHPIFQQFPSGDITKQHLPLLAFAVPNASPFCGIERGVGSDGWRDDKAPRHIQYRCDEYSSILNWVRQGRAVSYLPDYLIKAEGFRVLNISDCGFDCLEHIYMVWRPSFAQGWLNQLMDHIQRRLGESSAI